MDVRFGAFLESSLEQCAATNDTDRASASCHAASRALRHDACEYRGAACNHFTFGLVLEFPQCDRLLVTCFAPLLIRGVHVVRKAGVVALERINKDVVPLAQTAHARQHGVFFRWQPAQGHLPRGIFVKIIREGATGEIARKSHFSDSPNGGAFFGRQSLKCGQHVIGDHPIDR